MHISYYSLGLIIGLGMHGLQAADPAPPAPPPPPVFLIPDNAPVVADFGGQLPGTVLNFSVAPGQGVTALTAKVDNPGPDSWVVRGLSFTATVVANFAGIHTGIISGTYQKSSPSSAGLGGGYIADLPWSGIARDFAGTLAITFVDALSTIPDASRVQAMRCLCTNSVLVTTTPPTATVLVNLTSSRANNVDVFDPATGATGTDGKFTSKWSSRKEGTLQAITNYIHSADYNVLPADYETAFLATVYVLANETDYPGPQVENPKGLTGSYNLAFLRAVLMQGTGEADNGQLITINWADSPQPLGFSTAQFTTTNTIQGRFGPIGPTSIAADPMVIPQLAQVLLLAGTVTVPGGNTRIMSDTGGRVNGYHIDIFAGFGRAAAKGWTNPLIPIRLLSYGN